MPQGNNATLDKVLLQFPGVTQDSAASGELHVRNEHANIQYRINGIMLPDGVGAFGQILDTGIVGSLALADRRAARAIRPAHGRRAGHPDQDGRLQQFRQRQRLWRQPRHDHAELRIWRHRRADPVFRVGPLSAEQSRHRESDPFERGDPRPHLAGKGISLSLDRARSHQPPDLHERRVERHLPDSEQSRADARLHVPSASRTSIQRSSTSIRTSSTSSTSSPTRNRPATSTIRFPTSTATASCTSIPTRSAISSSTASSSDVYRQSFVNGIQEDTAWRWGFAHTLRFGFSVSAERSLVNNISSTVAAARPIPADPTGRQRSDCRRSPSSIPAPRPAGCSAPMCRTSGRSPTN